MFLVSAESSIWRVIMPEDGGGDGLVPWPCVAPDDECDSSIYILEFHALVEKGPLARTL
jgi:hypothetical protein